ncbi:hypothetical protein [Polaribacter sp. IC073]|uniref:hypothetical protein n=1 Tax=Polaribacter sp. IC073 TaxID=2508540 RepID=UPI0011BFBFDD|nr:hypothetical protein [Polaribacter sp. IC073]TXD47329.1 hypothetical protein ES045_12080 [Polaribacter sp. IC073]
MAEFKINLTNNKTPSSIEGFQEAVSLNSDVVANKNAISGLSNGIKNSINLSTPTPTENGIYPCEVSGTYSNFGGIVVSLTNKITSISVKDIDTTPVYTIIESDVNVPFENTTFDKDNNLKAASMKLSFDKFNPLIEANATGISEERNRALAAEQVNATNTTTAKLLAILAI